MMASTARSSRSTTAPPASTSRRSSGPSSTSTRPIACCSPSPPTRMTRRTTSVTTGSSLRSSSAVSLAQMSAQPASRRVLANDFAAQWEEVQDDMVAAIDRVGRSGWLVLGDEVSQFEEELARWWGLPQAVGVASGLDALEIALRLGGVGPGDRVLTTALTAFATTLAVLRVGAEPMWCDVDDTGGMDLQLALEALAGDASIKAALPV